MTQKHAKVTLLLQMSAKCQAWRAAVGSRPKRVAREGGLKQEDLFKNGGTYIVKVREFDLHRGGQERCGRVDDH